jgi:hypothetical protein
MKWSDLPLNPSPRTLRQFAALWLVFFLGAGYWQWARHGRAGAAVVMVSLALIVGIVGLIAPRTVRWIFVGWIVAAFPIGWLMSQLMVALLLYGVFTPIGLLFRLVARDPLQIRSRRQSESYWTVKPAPTDVSRYFKQF